MSLFDAASLPVQISIERQIACAEREIKQRQFVYPRRVEAGKMTQAKADEELAAMQAILATLQQFKAEREGMKAAP